MKADLFAGLAVSDFGRAVDWVERLLGEPVTFQPHDTEAVWTLADHRFLYVLLRPDRTGQGMVTMIVDDLDGVVEAAAGRGIHPTTRDTYGNGVRKVTYVDPDGNEVAFGGLPPG